MNRPPIEHYARVYKDASDDPNAPHWSAVPELCRYVLHLEAEVWKEADERVANQRRLWRANFLSHRSVGGTSD